jgi:hypothetical protein
LASVVGEAVPSFIDSDSSITAKRGVIWSCEEDAVDGDWPWDTVGATGFSAE